MDDQNSNNSIHKPAQFQVTIDEFKSEMSNEEIKGKRNEIIELLTNHNEFSSYENFNRIINMMKQACRRGDLELLEIYLSKEIIIETGKEQLLFKINKTKKTASLFKVLQSSETLIVPRTIKYEREDYSVTSIAQIGNRIKKIEFPANSEVHTFYEESFSSSKVESISIPPSLVELKDGWCSSFSGLITFNVSESNSRFLFKDNKYLVGKNDEQDENFDILLFARRDIKEAEIQANIKIISPYAFKYCKELSKVEIPMNSNLQIIGEDAFSFTKIKQIYIPSSLIELKDGWCSWTPELTVINVSESNNRFLFKDDKYLIGKSDEQNENFDNLLFARRDIKEVEIPSNIKIISSYAFAECNQIEKFEFAPNSNLQTIGKYAFHRTNITQISIPSSVSTICECAFLYCSQLSKVDIPLNSNLRSIEKIAFACTNITQIYIPSNVSKLCSDTFDNCMQLSKVEIPKNSNLKIIDECPFSDTDITQIYIPSNLIELKDGWCFCMHKLITINVSESNNRFLFIDDQYLIGKSNEQNENFDILLFARRDIKKAKIPKNIKIISPYAFADCCKLSKIEIQVNSSLKTIGQHSFENTGITQIFIPSNVSKICQFAFYKCCQLSKVEIAKSIKIISSYAFADCDKLSKVEIPANSNLETIGECAFKLTAITQIYIPSSVSTICEDAFEFCPKLQILEISEESKLHSLDRKIFGITSSDAIVMIPQKIRKVINLNIDY